MHLRTEKFTGLAKMVCGWIGGSGERLRYLDKLGMTTQEGGLSPVLAIELDDAFATHDSGVSSNSAFCLSPTNVPADLAAAIQQKLLRSAR